MTRVFIIASLGIFWGLVIYGVHAAAANYNLLVGPEKQLEIMQVGKKEVTLWGEKLQLLAPDTVRVLVLDTCREMYQACKHFIFTHMPRQ